MAYQCRKNPVTCVFTLETVNTLANNYVGLSYVIIISAVILKLSLCGKTKLINEMYI